MKARCRAVAVADAHQEHDEQGGGDFSPAGNVSSAPARPAQVPEFHAGMMAERRAVVRAVLRQSVAAKRLARKGKLSADLAKDRSVQARALASWILNGLHRAEQKEHDNADMD